MVRHAANALARLTNPAPPGDRAAAQGKFDMSRVTRGKMVTRDMSRVTCQIFALQRHGPWAMRGGGPQAGVKRASAFAEIRSQWGTLTVRQPYGNGMAGHLAHRPPAPPPPRRSPLHARSNLRRRCPLKCQALSLSPVSCVYEGAWCWGSEVPQGHHGWRRLFRSRCRRLGGGACRGGGGHGEGCGVGPGWLARVLCCVGLAASHACGAQVVV